MNDDFRSQLRALADRIAGALDASPPLHRAGAEASASNVDRARALATALAAIAEGDVSLSVTGSIVGTPEGDRLAEAVHKVRELVMAARGAVSAGTERMDEVRASAERAAESASRQRVSLERTAEQMRQLVQRVSELATAAGEIGEVSDRSSLLALNTGIEGLRVGGEVARTLGSLGDEMRKLAIRAAEGSRDLASGLKTVLEQTRSIVVALEEVRTAAKHASDEAARAVSAAETARRADATLATTLSAFRALDGETEAVVSRLDAAAQRMAREIAEAGARLGGADEAGRVAIRAAIANAERAVGAAQSEAATPASRRGPAGA